VDSKTELIQAEMNYKQAKLESELLLNIKDILSAKIESVLMLDGGTTFEFSEPIDLVSCRRLNALGFSIEGRIARSDCRLSDSINLLREKLAKRFNGSEVKKVIIDDEFACVTATVDGVTNVDCGHLEDYS